MDTKGLHCPSQAPAGGSGEIGLRTGAWLQDASAPASELLLLPQLSYMLALLCLFAQRAVQAELHKEGRESRSHVDQKDFQSQQTHPKREEGGKR